MMNSDYPGHLWALTPHVSRGCFARVLARENAGEALVYCCRNCDSQVEGEDVRRLCACGSLLADGSDAYVRCEVNEDPTPEYPDEIVAVALGKALWGVSQGPGPALRRCS